MSDVYTIWAISVTVLGSLGMILMYRLAHRIIDRKIPDWKKDQ